MRNVVNAGVMYQRLAFVAEAAMIAQHRRCDRSGDRSLPSSQPHERTDDH